MDFRLLDPCAWKQHFKYLNKMDVDLKVVKIIFFYPKGFF